MIFKQSDLVLKVNNNYDVTKIKFKDWEPFLVTLCGDREYQIEAIKQAVIYLISEKYDVLSDLAVENYNNNTELKKKYTDCDSYIEKLQLPEKKYATIDLATGTGKSYVIYAVAQIMLGLGLVDRVLVLCPSLTIEAGLKEKFNELSGSATLKNMIPESAIVKNPRIIDGTCTIEIGDICIENIHAVYDGNSSSIEESLSGKGKRTLVLNDEVHHVFNKVNGNDSDSKDIKKWKEFLLNENYDFKYILGFTGTAYIDNDYFLDVIFRYSLKQAIEDKFVKNIEYVQKDDSININDKFQKIYQNHKDNKDKYALIKPITILITKDISAAENLYEDLVDFISKQEQIDSTQAEKKVLIVTSNRKHKPNVERLKFVDSKDDSVEWIVSVSMLTEGWDVKNVFQIVPWEDRAFNSKLLIAQVLGRGLRIPSEYNASQPKVIVFNHDSWSKNIKQLVREVLEIEVRIFSKILKAGDRTKYNFSLYNFNYERKEEQVESTKKTEKFDYSRLKEEGIKLEAQSLVVEKSSTYETVGGANVRDKNYAVEYESYTVSDVLDKLYIEFEIRDWEGRVLQLGATEYSKNNLPPRSEIEEIVKKSMENVGIEGDRLIEKNRMRILNAFKTLLRKTNKTVVSTIIADAPYEIKTCDMGMYSNGLGSFRSGNTVFYSSDWENDMTDMEQKAILSDIIEDDMLPKRATKEVNEYLFKTPVNLVLTSQNPERTFVENLCKEGVASEITSWIKSRDVAFYSINYSIKYGGKESKTRTYSHKQFNPDFFLLVRKEDMDFILVIETKDDKDASEENIAKYKAGKKHFEDLNEKLESQGIKQKYYFNFLSPNSFPTFFEYVKSGAILEGKFKSELEILLEENDE